MNNNPSPSLPIVDKQFVWNPASLRLCTLVQTTMGSNLGYKMNGYIKIEIMIIIIIGHHMGAQNSDNPSSEC